MLPAIRALGLPVTAGQLKEIVDDEKQKFTLTSISRTAHNLGITTIASRIETQTQLDTLSDNYVEVFQGFIVDK